MSKTPQPLSLLVLVERYPSDCDHYSSAFVHARCCRYIAVGHDVTVLNFQAPEPYQYDGIDVVTRKQISSLDQYDALICHAPNIRHHLRWLIRHALNCPATFFIFHGHEVIQKSRYYPAPFPFKNTLRSQLRNTVTRGYDWFKRRCLRWYINDQLGNMLYLIFVSDWMKQAFYDNISLPTSQVEPYSKVINNPVAEPFIVQSYQSNLPKKGDVVTIRPLDQSIKAIDIVVRIARENPALSFHIYGKGDYFLYYDCPPNVTVYQHYLAQSDIPDLLNQYRAALMPTRLDSQGVMACEMATFGIPLITSDLPVCHMMLDDFNSVYYLDNNKPHCDVAQWLDSLDLLQPPNKMRFANSETVDQEIAYIASVCDAMIAAHASFNR